jgi:hypothetical protein
VGAILLWRGTDSGGNESLPVRLASPPSPQLDRAARPPATPFADAVAALVQAEGLLTVTVHVCLADRRRAKLPPGLGDGEDPSRNLWWGARHGVETHLARTPGWSRVHVDSGGGSGAVRRVVFHRRVDPGIAWQARGVSRLFDLFLMAAAWPAGRIHEAARQPLRDALCDDPAALTIGDRLLWFGAGSVMTGYLGQSPMDRVFQDPFAGLAISPRDRQMGVFYICPLSAVHFHASSVEHGLYPVLFVRHSVVPEAYCLEGVLSALAAGDLEGGFIAAAAERYSRFQKGVSPARAAAMFFR